MSQPLEKEEHPWQDNLIADAHRLTGDLEMALQYCGMVRMSDSTTQQRLYLMEVGRTAEKVSRAVQDALRRP